MPCSFTRECQICVKCYRFHEQYNHVVELLEDEDKPQVYIPEVGKFAYNPNTYISFEHLRALATWIYYEAPPLFVERIQKMKMVEGQPRKGSSAGLLEFIKKKNPHSDAKEKLTYNLQEIIPNITSLMLEK